MMKETLCRRRCLLKIPKKYTGFKAETNVLRSTRAGDASKGPPAGLTASSLRCAPKLLRLSGRRSDERGTGWRQVAKPQRFLGW
jgi:hypothetical protein